MLVRAVRSLQRGRVVRAVAAAVAFALAIGVAPSRALLAQEPAPSQPKTHTVKRGDTLWDIAKLYLGDPYLWPEIYRLNTDVVEDPHWIYPGEVLKLPGEPAKVVAVTPPQPVAPTPTPAPATRAIEPAPAPTPAAPPRDTTPAPRSTVRRGEYLASPWVDQRGGPRNSGYIIQSGDVPGIASGDRSRMSLYDPVVFAPPVGAVAPEHERYLSYRLGELIEGFGQIVIPTGVIEVTRAPRNGEAALGRVVALFSQMKQGEHLIPLDSGVAAMGAPVAVANGRSGKVRWIDNNPVLPSMQRYVILDLSGRDVSTGDQLEFYQPRQKPSDSQTLAIPEVALGRAQVLRVTPYGATAIVTSVAQPKLEQGTAARVAAKMP